MSLLTNLKSCGPGLKCRRAQIVNFYPPLFLGVCQRLATKLASWLASLAGWLAGGFRRLADVPCSKASII